jgi:putative DNA primase/helicase
MRDEQSVLAGAAQLEAMAVDLGLLNRPQNPISPNVQSVDVWPVPEPLEQPQEAIPYPVESLPNLLREAVEEVQGFTQAPPAMVACAALSTLSIAAQSYFDVQRADKLSGPISIFSLLLADSGERKSSCDGFFKQAIIDYENEQAELAKPEIAKFKADYSAWEAVRSGLLDRIKADAKAGKPSDEAEQILQRHQSEEPQAPRVPRLLYSDFTPEKLTYNLSKVWPAGGVLSSEAGAVFGSHGMTGDSLMRTLAILNQLWDGATLTYDRKTSESYTVKGARLSMALQVQPTALKQFVDKSGDLARGIGFFARFLMAFPESTQGTRLYKEAPPTWPALAQYYNRITAILNQQPAIDENGTLTTQMLTLSPDAKTAWIEFHNAVESQLSEDGDLAAIRDVASKIADNAVRIAALFHAVQGHIGQISFDDFDRASVIASWHLHEALRFFGMASADDSDHAVQRLDAWLITNSMSGAGGFTTTYLMQKGPRTTRSKTKLIEALECLSDLGRIKTYQAGRSTEVFVNPALIGGAK